MSFKIKVGQLRIWTHVTQPLTFRVIAEFGDLDEYDLRGGVFGSEELVGRVQGSHIRANSKVYTEES